ncbi:VOC family protein [Rhodococcus sp. 14C212]|uniref:VOC family protein n=1 Tax=Rhodococcus sp. 14C212 TaxID=2711209 RepID=UPI0013EA7CEB|nr:VOC family protein [Rhodococcus sp. 14C212]NGP06762.1 VOC family protein [Rhodococcus sp. 14C212]
MFFLHANIVCTDFDRSLDFYTRVMGGSTLGVAEGDGGIDLSLALGATGPSGYRAAMIHWDNGRHGPYLDLLEWREKGEHPKRNGKDVGLGRLAFRVDDLDSTVAMLEAEGIQLNSPPGFDTVGRWPMKFAFFHDPDGVLLEIIQLMPRGTTEV